MGRRKWGENEDEEKMGRRNWGENANGVKMGVS